MTALAPLKSDQVRRAAGKIDALTNNVCAAATTGCFSRWKARGIVVKPVRQGGEAYT